MKLPTPLVYINGRRMDTRADQESPVLAGLTITAGAQSYVDMSEPETLRLELAIRNPADLRFIDLGHEIAVYQPAAAPVRETTYFVGRIQNLSAEPDPEIPGALRVIINATDTHTELLNASDISVDLYETDGENRWAWINTLRPDGWTGRYFGTDFPARVHARVKLASTTYLELFDRWCRSQLMLRRVTSVFSPETGTKLQLEAITDGTRALRPAALGRYASRAWGVVYRAPGDNNYLLSLSSRNVLADPGWRKDTEDLITAVEIQSFLAAADETSDTGTKVTSSERRVRSSELIRRYGKRTISFDTDLRWSDSAAVQSVQDHWLMNGTGWRVTELTIKDSDALTEMDLFFLLDATQRFTTFAVVRNLYPNRPDTHETDLRAMVIGHTATWNGRKWDITLTAGRPLHEPDGGDWWTFERLEASTSFGTDTAASTGDVVTFRDFIRIGNI